MNEWMGKVNDTGGVRAKDPACSFVGLPGKRNDTIDNVLPCSVPPGTGFFYPYSSHLRFVR